MLRPFLSVSLVLIVFGFLLAVFQNRLIFFPSRLHRTPNVFIPGREVSHVFFPAADGVTLHGIWVKSSATDPVILWSHGNAGHLGHRLDRLAVLSQSLSANVFAYDYRGYGLSSGTPTVPGIMADAEGALAWLQASAGVPLDRLVAYGESLGAAVAIDLVRRRPEAFAGLVVESGFKSLRYRAGRMFPIIGPLILTADLPSDTTLASFTYPLLVIHSRADEIIPFAEGQALFDTSPSHQKRLVDFPSYGHNDAIWEDPAYILGWKAFIADLKAKPDPL